MTQQPQQRIPGAEVPIPETFNGQPMTAFVPWEVPPPAMEPESYDCEFSQSQFNALVEMTRSMPDTARAASQLALSMEAIASCEIENIVVRPAEFLSRLNGSSRIGSGAVGKARLCRRATAHGAGEGSRGEGWSHVCRELHRRMFAEDPEWERRFRTQAGEYRDRQNYIGGGGRISFVPPPPERVPELVGAMCRWMESPEFRELPLSLQIATAHYQFETIHPYPDGNGRVGRAINQALAARAAGSSSIPWTMSLLMSSDRRDYYDTLRMPRRHGVWDYTVGCFDNWLANDVLRWGRKLRELDEFRRGWQEDPGFSADARSVAVALLRNPYASVSGVSRHTDVSARNCSSALRELQAAGIVSRNNLEGAPGHGRSVMYHCPAVGRIAGIRAS